MCVQHNYTKGAKIKITNTNQRLETKVVKSLLDFIILQLLNTQPMHSYQLILQIRRTFGIRFSPSTVYPLLVILETNGIVISRWNLDALRPRKIYQLTKDGKSILTFTEKSLQTICRKLNTTPQETTVVVNPEEQLTKVRQVF